MACIIRLIYKCIRCFPLPEDVHQSQTEELVAGGGLEELLRAETLHQAVAGGGGLNTAEHGAGRLQQQPTPQQLAEEFNTEGAIVVKAKKLEPTFYCVSLILKKC